MKSELIVVPLGPGDPAYLTLQSCQVMKNPSYRLILRTSRHPVADWLKNQGIPFESLDRFYDEFDDFDRMHLSMAEWLWNESLSGKICFAVMDPLNDQAVEALKGTSPSPGSLKILPGTSEMNLFLSQLPYQFPATSRVQVFSASEFIQKSFVDPQNSCLITELDSFLLCGQVKLKLLELFPDELEIAFFPASGQKASPPVRIIPLYQLDAQKKYDHTTAVYIPGTDFMHRSRFTFSDLLQIVSRLRSSDGCPWDRKQTHRSLRPYLIEEAWEAVNSIDEGNMFHLADELGDVLFQVVFHASIAESFDEFSLTDILSDICLKMIRRHPHVFRDEPGSLSHEEADQWETIKRTETGRKTVEESLNDVSTALPSLKYAAKLLKKINQIPGASHTSEDIAAEIQYLADKLYDEKSFSESGMGLLLMKCAELCLSENQDAELLLHRQAESMKAKWQRSDSAESPYEA